MDAIHNRRSLADTSDTTEAVVKALTPINQDDNSRAFVQFKDGNSWEGAVRSISIFQSGAIMLRQTHGSLDEDDPTGGDHSTNVTFIAPGAWLIAEQYNGEGE